MPETAIGPDDVLTISDPTVNDVSGHLPPRDAIEALTWIMVSAFRGWDATPPTVGEFREAFIAAVRQAMKEDSHDRRA